MFIVWIRDPCHMPIFFVTIAAINKTDNFLEIMLKSGTEMDYVKKSNKHLKYYY